MAILSKPFGFMKLCGSSSIFVDSSSVGSTLATNILTTDQCGVLQPEAPEEVAEHHLRLHLHEVVPKALPGQYVGPDVYQFWNFDTHPSFSYSKNALDDKN